MKIHLLIVISLISFALATGCIEPQSSSSSPGTAVTTDQATPPPTSGSFIIAITQPRQLPPRVPVSGEFELHDVFNGQPSGKP
jgi:hypothetical protein